MIQGLRENGIEVIECHANIWQGVEDKSQLSGLSQKMKFILSYLLSYPILIYQYLRAPCHDVVIVGYMGQFDVLAIWPFALIRGVPICWDVFISLYDTVVIDRKLVSQNSIIAGFFYLLEWVASRAASQLLLDTRSHAEYFEQLYRLPPHSVRHVYVGAEIDVFRRGKTALQKSKGIFTVLFYGQFIPLHGIDIIVRAVKIIEKSTENIRWIIIGEGQEQPHIDEFIKKAGIKSIHRISCDARYTKQSIPDISSWQTAYYR